GISFLVFLSSITCVVTIARSHNPFNSRPTTVYKRRGCCVKTMCGRSLHDGVVFVGIVAIGISFLVFLSSVTCVVTIARSHNPFNSRPVSSYIL
ncbi:unnamed protein product, partial [Leptidea sinapis]